MADIESANSKNQNLAQIYFMLPVNTGSVPGEAGKPPVMPLWKISKQRLSSEYRANLLSKTGLLLTEAEISTPFRAVIYALFDDISATGRGYIKDIDNPSLANDAKRRFADERLVQILIGSITPGILFGRIGGIFDPRESSPIEANEYREAFGLFNDVRQYVTQHPSEFSEEVDDMGGLDYFNQLRLYSSSSIRDFLDTWRREFIEKHRLAPEDLY